MAVHHLVIFHVAIHVECLRTVFRPKTRLAAHTHVAHGIRECCVSLHQIHLAVGLERNGIAVKVFLAVGQRVQARTRNVLDTDDNPRVLGHGRPEFQAVLNEPVAFVDRKHCFHRKIFHRLEA